MPHVGIAELSQLLATVILVVCIAENPMRFSHLGTPWLSCYAGALLPTYPRYSELARNAVGSAGRTGRHRHERLWPVRSRHFSKFRNEYEQIPIKSTVDGGSFHLNNTLFGGTDALVAYCMVRQFQPRPIIEIGSGLSSLLLAEAVLRNDSSALICIEPFPRKFVRKGFPGLQSLIEKKVQDIDLEFFSQLNPGDVLFIDSSHTVKIGGDVNYLFLEVLLRLKPGHCTC